ncbi:hypothetical protein CASFOL_017177 [Castilleja foliolosa]|uniref:RING-type domain-containing protein n=1 Tax=Castilleja foliolosa TaxID=1961234 RepID=A0ABD3DAA9_9LAMI
MLNEGDETAEEEDKDRSRSSKHRGDDVDRSTKRSSSKVDTWRVWIKMLKKGEEKECSEVITVCRVVILDVQDCCSSCVVRFCPDCTNELFTSVVL